MTIEKRILELSLLRLELEQKQEFVTDVKAALESNDNKVQSAREYIIRRICHTSDVAENNRWLGNTDTSKYFRRMVRYFKKVAKDFEIDIS